MRQLLFIYLLIVICDSLTGQADSESLTGKVSFVSSRNIYVKFKSTEGLTRGDTLYFLSGNGLIPVLVIDNLSSVSCVCTSLSGASLSVDNLIIARIRNKPSPKGSTVPMEDKPAIPGTGSSDSTIKSREIKGTGDKKQKISGSISAQSYSELSNTPAGDSHRFRYTLSLLARNISDSKFSAETYISFKHKQGEWAETGDDIFNALKIYDLAVRFDPDKTMYFSLGRRINPRISSIGASDGLQFEKSFHKFSTGVIFGTRPDYENYSYNPHLLQYGAYLSYNASSTDAYSGTSLAFMQQMNNSRTDRRFLYFQHSQLLLRDLYLFGTFEIDLYKLENDVPINTFDLTGLYFSLRYSITKNLSLTGSYDTRKNVIYYETYKSGLDSLLEKEKRESFRLTANYRLNKNMILGVQSGYRYLKSDPNPSINMRGYFTFNRIPGLNLAATLNATYLESNYMNGSILGISFSRDFLSRKLHTEIGYRYVDYLLPESSQSVRQNTGTADISWQFYRNMMFSVYYEGAFEQNNIFHRLNLQLRKRF